MKMYRILSLFLVITAVAGCNSNDVELVSKWRLIEQLTDPGDGSGTFQPVVSSKVVEFWDDQTITSNGSICSMSATTNSASSGTYNESDMQIEVNGCTTQAFPLTYEMEDGNLILNYPCIEPCREKYEPVQ